MHKPAFKYRTLVRGCVRNLQSESLKLGVYEQPLPGGPSEGEGGRETSNDCSLNRKWTCRRQREGVSQVSKAVR